MVKFLAMLGLILSTTVWAAPAVQHGLSDGDRFLLNNRMGGVAHNVQLGEKLYGAKRIARVVYDVTDLDRNGVSNGSSTAAHPLNVSLPAKAVIVRSWLQIVTAFTDVGSGTVAIHCEDANNIKTATDFTSLSGLVEGESTGAMSAAKASIAAACEITATVATASQGLGRALIFVEYVVGE
jgi:hypothetical protein